MAPLLERYGDFATLLTSDGGEAEAAAWRRLRMSETSGRPLGGDDWLSRIEADTGRALKRRKRGPKPRAEAN